MYAPDFSIQNKKFLVAGAASGFGAAISQMIDHLGGQLILIDRDTVGLESLRRDLKESTVLACHRCDDSDVLELTACCESR